MKIVCANPPTYLMAGRFNRPIRFPTYNYATPVMHPPVLLAYVAAYLRSKGHSVDLMDASVSAMTVKDFVLAIMKKNPDFVVFETSTPSIYNDISVAREIKDAYAGKIIFVGPHVSALPVETLKISQDAIDAVIMGEYEFSLAEYIENGGYGTQGVCYRDENGVIIRNEPRDYIQDLDILPFPARDLLPNYDYFDPILKNPFTFVLGGRGCPHQCTYCNWPQVMTGRKYRFRSAKNIVDELEMLQKTYTFKSFLFNDDTFTANKKHVIEVCEEMKERGINIPWACYSRADLNDTEVLQKLREAGCFMLKIGVESGDPQIIRNIRKHYDLEKVEAGVRLMKKYGFHVHGTFVFGFPGETLETIQKTINFAIRLSPTTVQFSSAIPYPGCELFDELKMKGFLLTENWEEYMPMHAIFETPDLSAEELKKSVERAYKQYYFRPEYFLTGLKLFISNPRVVHSNLKRLITMALS